jgi:hypothetical protein
MKNFKKIKDICDENSKISTKVIDEFLLYYAAGRNNLEHVMEKGFAAYKHITKNLQKEVTNRLKSQFIIHKVFRKEGFIKSYLNQPALKKLGARERDFLEFQAEHSWKFSFSIIKYSPAENFFEMVDVFTNEEFLLYSPGVTKTLEVQPIILWFNLISFNGTCWQSFGPIGAYQSFEPDDIFFFATELDPQINDEQELLENLENNPLPYMMLISGGNYPLIFNKKDQLVHVAAEYEIDMMDTKSLTGSFKTEYVNDVYRLSLKKWSEPPHFSQAFYDEINSKIVLTAMTDRGFSALVKGLNEFGYDFSSEPLIRVNLTMITTSADILRKKIRLTNYDEFFIKKTSPETRKNLDNLNVLMGLILPDINANQEPNIEMLALKAGVDIQTTRNLVKLIQEKVKGPGKSKGGK